MFSTYSLASSDSKLHEYVTLAVHGSELMWVISTRILTPWGYTIVLLAGRNATSLEGGVARSRARTGPRPSGAVHRAYASLSDSGNRKREAELTLPWNTRLLVSVSLVDPVGCTCGSYLTRTGLDGRPLITRRSEPTRMAKMVSPSRAVQVPGQSIRGVPLMSAIVRLMN